MSIRRVIRGIALEFFAKSLFFDTQTCELHSFFYEKKKYKKQRFPKLSYVLSIYPLQS